MDILPYRIPHTSYEVAAAISKKDLAYLQILPEAEKMEPFLEATFYSY